MIDAFLLHVYPAVLAMLFAAWATSLRLNAAALAAPFKRLVSARGGLGVLVLMAAFLFVKLAVDRPRHQVYFDEFIHEDIAANLARDGTFGESLAGGPGIAPVRQVSAWPAGYHVLLGSVYKVFGFSEAAAFGLSVGFATASLALIFLLAALVFEDEKAGLLAAFLLAASPPHVRFAGAADLTACSEFWILTALLTLALHLEVQTLSSCILCLLSLTYACHVRAENIVLAAFVALLPMISPSARRAFSRDGSLVAGATALLLLAPLCAVLIRNRAAGLLGYAGSPEGMLADGFHHGFGNLIFLLSAPWLSFVLAPLAALGLYRLPRGPRERSCVALALAFVFLAACSLHANGLFRTGANERLALPTLILVVLAASGAASTLRTAGRRQAATAAAAALAFLLACRPSYGKGPLARYEDEYRLVRESRALLPRDAVVLTFCPGLILTAGERGAVTPVELPGGIPELAARLGGRPLVVFKDVWWYKFAGASGATEKALTANGGWKSISTATIDSREYGFYGIRLAGAGDIR